ncbi:aminopeptidase P family protein [Anaerobacillus alkaliphilus]|uniref:Aminopeptidase P family protein n=1 Tax=Anaerobacillus alkaliphilus TaxID=1548597 RepID=A0A4Q0VMH8_9BACI|nr:Xaa-Pro peptidase family protein [Anaerobacillus alkaliphilus]RXI96166.1 aminopeptidase P family protein [Anaerobacillus alkaliphilus]
MKLTKVREKLTNLGLEALLITSPYNRRYLSEFTGTAGVLLVSMSDAYVIVDGRYTDQARTQAKEFAVVEHNKNLLEVLASLLETLNIRKLGYEADHTSVTQLNTYQKTLHTELVGTSNIVESLRIIKSEEELVLMRKAAGIAEEAFEYVLGMIKPGITERDISAELIYQMQKLGASGSSNDPIVASGVRSALPHGRATDKVIEHGDIITMDYGAVYNGYLSDMTRTIAVGEPSAELKKIYKIVLETLEYTKEQARPGLSVKDYDQLARDYIEKYGYGKYFIHGIGHGLGLELHEAPTVAGNECFEENMVFTVEPGIYISGLGGVRIEDDIIIKKDGIENLTPSSKQLMIL